MFQLVDIRYVCLVHFLLHDTPEKICQQDVSPVSLRGHESGGMKSGVSAHCAQQLY